MPLGSTAFWGAVIPVETINLMLNPSFERGTTGASAITGASLGSTSGLQQFGAWSLVVAPGANGTSGAILGTFTTNGNGTQYSASAYVNGVAGIQYLLGIGDSAGNNITNGGSIAFTGAGTWQRYDCAIVEAAGATTRSVVLKKVSGVSQGSVFVDGVQVEPVPVTTYIDGDQPGGTWTGAAHQSATTRSGQVRSGGTVIALGDLIGVQPDVYPGVGMPPMQNSFQSYAILDGAQYQRTRAAERAFTLTFRPIFGASLTDLHTTRRNLINTFKIDAVTPQQPTRFWYTGAGGTVQIDAFYDSGLELNESMTTVSEEVSVKFLAFDPYWYSTTQQGTTLAPRVGLGSTNFVVKRAPSGQWGTLGANGTTFQFNAATPAVYASLINDSGTVFFGGNWGSVGGTVFPNIAMYYPTTNRFGTLTTGTVGGVISALAKSPAGTLFAGGNFLTAGGTTISHVAQWNGNWGSLPGGTISSNSAHAVYALLYSNQGSLFMGGTFTSVGGTATKSMGIWSGAAGGTLTNGTVNTEVFTLAQGLDQKIYVGGDFTSAGGTQAICVASWNGTWGTLSGGTMGIAGGPEVDSIAVGLNGLLYIGGYFSTINGGTFNSAAAWNGVQFSALGSGVYFGGITTGFVQVVNVDPTTGMVDAGGIFDSANGIPTNDSYARWNSYTWLAQDIDLPGNGTVNTIVRAGDSTLYIAGQFSGTAQASSVASVVNKGMAQAYPTIFFNNASSGTARLTRMVNTTTGDALYFNLALLAQEQATLTLTPGSRSFTSSARGNLFGYIQPGSNLSAFRLMPGTNTITFYADNDSLQTLIYWTPRHWSADAGMIL